MSKMMLPPAITEVCTMQESLLEVVRFLGEGREVAAYDVLVRVSTRAKALAAALRQNESWANPGLATALADHVATIAPPSRGAR
jgi:hypothetical protein